MPDPVHVRKKSAGCSEKRYLFAKKVWIRRGFSTDLPDRKYLSGSGKVYPAGMVLI